jgi:hypothetical protein
MVELVSKLGVLLLNFYQKKQYGLTTLKADNDSNNVSIFGMPEENDWILNGLDLTIFRLGIMAYYVKTIRKLCQ